MNTNNVEINKGVQTPTGRSLSEREFQVMNGICGRLIFGTGIACEICDPESLPFFLRKCA